MQKLHVFEALGLLRMPGKLGKSLETHQDTRRPDGGGICKLRDGQGTGLMLKESWLRTVDSFWLTGIF